MKWTTIVFAFITLWIIITLAVYSSTNPFTATPLQILAVAILTIVGMILFVIGALALAVDIAEDVKKYYEKYRYKREN